MHIAFLVLISALAILEMVMAFFYYYNESTFALFVDLVCLLARVLLFMCLAFQMNKFSMQIQISSHVDVNGDVVVTGICVQT